MSILPNDLYLAVVFPAMNVLYENIPAQLTRLDRWVV